jgi:hypothetical protein
MKLSDARRQLFRLFSGQEANEACKKRIWFRAFFRKGYASNFYADRCEPYKRKNSIIMYYNMLGFSVL